MKEKINKLKMGAISSKSTVALFFLNLLLTDKGWFLKRLKTVHGRDLNARQCMNLICNPVLHQPKKTQA